MSDQKALQGSKTEMRELLEGMKEDIYLPSTQITKRFLYKKRKAEKIESVAIPATHHLEQGSPNQLCSIGQHSSAQVDGEEET